MEWKTEGIVLRSVDYKENDKLLTVFTPDRGKLTAGVRGVKKPTAKLAFCAQPFAFCEYVFAEKNGRLTVTGAYSHDGFYELRTDIVRYYAACAVAEICDSLAPTDGDHEGLFIAAVNALKELSLTDGDAAETLLTFLLTALSEGGYMLDLGDCGVCGNAVKGKIFFDFDGGYFSCPSCASGVRASESTYEVLRMAAGLSYRENKLAGGRKRALKLVRAYLMQKTDDEYPCLKEFIGLYTEKDNEEKD